MLEFHHCKNSVFSLGIVKHFPAKTTMRNEAYKLQTLLVTFLFIALNVLISSTLVDNLCYMKEG